MHVFGHTIKPILLYGSDIWGMFNPFRERPFNLRGGGGGYVFFLKKNILIPNVAGKNILILVEKKKK